MNRGVANTLRVLGIIVAALLTLLACGFLLLQSICGIVLSSFGQSVEVVPLVGAVVVMVGSRAASSALRPPILVRSIPGSNWERTGFSPASTCAAFR